MSPIATMQHGLSVCELDALVSPEKMAKLIEMLFGKCIRGPRNHYHLGAQILPRKGAPLGGHTWTTTFDILNVIRNRAAHVIQSLTTSITSGNLP